MKQPQRIPYGVLVSLPKKVKGTKRYDVSVDVAELYASSPFLTKEQKDKYIAETFKPLGGKLKGSLEEQAKTKSDTELMEIAKTETREPQIQAVIKELGRREEGRSYPTELPIYQIKGKHYYRDVQLGEYRNVNDPSDRMPINSVPNEMLEKPTKTLDQIRGGLGDNKPDSAFNPTQLEKGEDVEREHTDNPKIAKEIAKDHLTEDPEYYKKLAKMEKGDGYRVIKGDISGNKMGYSVIEVRNGFADEIAMFPTKELAMQKLAKIEYKRNTLNIRNSPNEYMQFTRYGDDDYSVWFTNDLKEGNSGASMRGSANDVLAESKSNLPIGKLNPVKRFLGIK